MPPEPPSLSLVIVEDNTDLAEGWRELLSLDGHAVRVFQHAEELLAKPEHLACCDVLISDYYLPDLNGLELIRRARQVCPELRVIMVSGVRDANIRQCVMALPRTRFLAKPARIDDLERSLAEVLSLVESRDSEPRASRTYPPEEAVQTRNPS